MNQTLLLSAQGVAKSFNGVPALKNGCLNLKAGSVHALCGGNGAGKSTFLNILMGILTRDTGDIKVKGQDTHFQRPADALQARISIITQELSPIPGMSVAENIYLGREPRLGKVIVDYSSLYAMAETLLKRLNFDIAPKTPMHRLSLAQTQLVEIAKAFSHESEIIIMDEPTSAIGEHETEVLFRAIHSAKEQGAGIVYVSHRLSEIFTIADQYTVFRDGGYVEDGNIADIDRRHLVRQIVGQEVRVIKSESHATTQPPLLEVKSLTRQNEFTDISLSVTLGEILGIYGLMGSGRSEFLNCVYGITKPTKGEVLLKDKIIPPGNTQKSIQRGLSLVTEDRKATGLVLTSTVAQNITLSALPLVSNCSIVNKVQEIGIVNTMIKRLKIKVSRMDMPVASLSGGNQQKVVLGRCMATNPICLLCDEPTRGIDEGAKREVYAFLASFVKLGGAVIVVSSEAPEVLEVSDRIAIFKKGRLETIISGHSATQEDLLHLAS